MTNLSRIWKWSLAACLGGLASGGCPQSSQLEFIAGQTGTSSQLGAVPSVRVLSPLTDLSIRGGTPVEVNWSVVATTNFAGLDVIFDLDTVPNNGNELFAFTNLSLDEGGAVLDTTSLEAGAYRIGVLLRERNELVAFAYAPGRLIINELVQLFFDSPRDNVSFDQSPLVTPRFDVDWTLRDPDSTVTVRIFLDPDQSPNGNEYLLRESASQTGDSFTFDLPTASFPPGTYRIVAIVNDGIGDTAFYAPGSIVIRSRLSSLIDLRDLDVPGRLDGAIFEGFNPRDNAGSFVKSTQDVDGDGFGDFLVVAQFGKPQYNVNLERTGVGEAYLVYGRPERFSGKINLNSTGTLFRGDIFAGVQETVDPVRPSRGITSFTLTSDWDGDGLRELAFGMPFTDSIASTLSTTGFGSALTNLDPGGYFRTGGVVIASSSVLRPDLLTPGRNVIGLSEIGTSPHLPRRDLSIPPCPEGVVGPKAPTGGAGVSYYNRHFADIVGVGSAVRLGCRFSSNEFGDQFGEVIAAGDFDSLLIAAPNRDPAVATLSQFGSSIEGAGVVSIFYNDAISGFAPWSTGQAPAAANGWPGLRDSGLYDDQIPHGGPYHYIVDDFRIFNTAVGPMQGSPGFWTVPADAPPCLILIDARVPNEGQTVRVFSEIESARIGNVVSVGDFNADGLNEFMLGSPLSNDGAGASFIVFGRLRELVRGGELSLEELGLPLNAASAGQARVFDGIRVIGAPGERLGQAQDDAGDFNGDGISDVLIGSSLTSGRRGGAAVFFGSRDVINLTQEEIRYSDIAARGLGVIFEGVAEGDFAGARVAGAGDVDGDGLDDILIAAPNVSVRSDFDLDGVLEIDREQCGAVYLVYGSSRLSGVLSLGDIGTEKLPGAVFVGRNSGDHLGAGLGQQGDRSFGIASAGDVDGDGRRELLLGSVSASPRDRVAAGEAYLIYGRGD